MTIAIVVSYGVLAFFIGMICGRVGFKNRMTIKCASFEFVKNDGTSINTDTGTGEPVEERDTFNPENGVVLGCDFTPFEVSIAKEKLTGTGTHEVEMTFKYQPTSAGSAAETFEPGTLQCDDIKLDGESIEPHTPILMPAPQPIGFVPDPDVETRPVPEKVYSDLLADFIANNAPRPGNGPTLTPLMPVYERRENRREVGYQLKPGFHAVEVGRVLTWTKDMVAVRKSDGTVDVWSRTTDPAASLFADRAMTIRI